MITEPLIKFNKVYIKQQQNEILNDISLDINEGEFVYFVGKTGSGKSTLADIFMGLLIPTEGDLIIDQNTIINKSSLANLYRWRLAISHVPQNIFLSDQFFFQPKPS